MLARKKKRQIKRERKRKNPHLYLRSFFQNVPPQNDIFVHPHCVRGPCALRRTRPHLERNTSALKYSETLHYRSKRKKNILQKLLRATSSLQYWMFTIIRVFYYTGYVLVRSTDGPIARRVAKWQTAQEKKTNNKKNNNN